MAKKKKDRNIIYEIDQSLDKKYVELLDEIRFMQADIDRAERKARKKAIRKMKKGNTFFNSHMEVNVREQVIRQMEGTDFFSRVMQILRDLRPIVIIIARLVMTLIVSILSLDIVKYRIKPQTLQTMHNLYSMAKSVQA